MEGDNLPVGLQRPQRQMDSAFESAEAKRSGLRGGPPVSPFPLLIVPTELFLAAGTAV